MQFVSFAIGNFCGWQLLHLVSYLIGIIYHWYLISLISYVIGIVLHWYLIQLLSSALNIFCMWYLLQMVFFPENETRKDKEAHGVSFDLKTKTTYLKYGGNNSSCNILLNVFLKSLFTTCSPPYAKTWAVITKHFCNYAKTFVETLHTRSHIQNSHKDLAKWPNIIIPRKDFT